MKPCELGPYRLARSEEWLEDGAQDSMALHQLAHATGQPGSTDRSDLQSEASQQATDPAVHVDELRHEELSADEQRPYLLRGCCLAMHWSVPPHAQKLRDPARVPPVRLDHHRR